MARFKNKIIASFLVVTMLIGSVSSLSIVNSDSKKIVYAKSKEYKNVEAKINHLIKSLKSNYLGIKNQPDWEKYLKEIKYLLNKLDYSDQVVANVELNGTVYKCETLINAIASINQVEKSMAPIDQGGYGNYLGMKNVDTWNYYLGKADLYLSVLSGNSTFEKQYDELVNRKTNVMNIIKGLENKFNKEYEPLLNLFEQAKVNNDIEKAKSILIEAEKLETCDKSNKLEMELKMFIEGNDSVNWRTMEGANFKYTMSIPKSFSKADLKSTPESESLIIKSNDESMKLGIEVSVKKSSINTGTDYYEKYLKNNNVTIIYLNNDSYEVEYINSGQVYNEKGILKNGYSYILKVNYPEDNSNEYKNMSEYIMKTFAVI